LTKVKSVLPEETMAIFGTMGRRPLATCTHNSPSVAGIWTSVPEQHPSMATFLKHLKSYKMPPSALMLRGFPISPPVQAIVVDCVLVVDPQLAAIIRDNTEPVMSGLKDSQAACPPHGKVIAPRKTRPFAARVAVVHKVLPTSHVGSATVQVLAPATLAKVEHIFPEESMTITRSMAATWTTRTRNSPAVASVRASVPEHHPGMTAFLKHLEPHKMPPRAKTPVGLPIAPPMQAIVVDCVLVVDPQLAAIIRDNAESVIAHPGDSHAACPTNCKVIAAGKTGPPSTGVTVVYKVLPASHIRPATIQILATTTLTEVEGLFPEKSFAIRGTSATAFATAFAFSACTRHCPSVSSVRSSVPKQHPSMPTTLKHLNSHAVYPRSKMLDSLPIPPSMQAIIVDCESVVNPQLASIIRDDAEAVCTPLADSHAACPSHCEVIATGKARPLSTSVAIVNYLDYATHVCPATVQVCATASLPKVEGLLAPTGSTRP